VTRVLIVAFVVFGTLPGFPMRAMVRARPGFVIVMVRFFLIHYAIHWSFDAWKLFCIAYK
jgi:hypothetical protein